jgi:micrococcal nuclease
VKCPPRRYWHEHRGAVFWFICLLLLLWRAYGASVPAGPERLNEGIHEVHGVIDAGTLLLTSGTHIRLLGISTPATANSELPSEGWSPEASQFAKNFIEKAGHNVRLTFGLERKDQSDCFLAFVWNGDAMLNEELVRAGLAYGRSDDRLSGPMKRRLVAAQDDARRAGRGLWSNTVALSTNSPK